MVIASYACTMLIHALDVISFFVVFFSNVTRQVSLWEMLRTSVLLAVIWDPHTLRGIAVAWRAWWSSSPCNTITTRWTTRTLRTGGAWRSLSRLTWLAWFRMKQLILKKSANVCECVCLFFIIQSVSVQLKRQAKIIKMVGRTLMEIESLKSEYNIALWCWMFDFSTHNTAQFLLFSN